MTAVGRRLGAPLGSVPRRRSARPHPRPHARPRSPPPDRRPHPGRRRTSRPSRASPRPARFAPHTHQWWKRSFLVRELPSEGLFRSLPRLPFSYQSSEEQQGGAKACGLGGARREPGPRGPRGPRGPQAGATRRWARRRSLRGGGPGPAPGSHESLDPQTLFGAL